MRDFRSDNTQGCSPEILEAIARAARGTMASYGDDEITQRVRGRCCDIFETDVEVFPVITGTAGNALALASMRPKTIVCHEDAHIVRDELGAPEFYTGGVRIIAVPGEGGKLIPPVIPTWLTAQAPVKMEMTHPSSACGTFSPLRRGEGSRRRLPSSVLLPACGEKVPKADEGCVMTSLGMTTVLSISNATEAGTVYTPDEMRALTASGDFSVHLDGARFANAAASTGANPAELTWRAGVDVMVLGGTKNGLIGAELIVVFRRELAKEIAPRWHRAGHRPAKMRFLSAQFEAYLTDDLWLRNARHANAMATQLSAGLDLVHPVQANEVFARFTPDVVNRLAADGYQFFGWPLFGADAFRMVTGFATTASDVSDFASSIAAASGVSGRAK